MSLCDASRAKWPREAFLRLVLNRRERLIPRIAGAALILSKTARTMIQKTYVLEASQKFVDDTKGHQGGGLTTTMRNLSRA